MSVDGRIMTAANSTLRARPAATGSRPRRPRSKRDCIVDAATRLFLEHGYETVSMDSVAGAAGVSKQTVYAHFGAKHALFEEIVQRNCGQMLVPVPAGDAPGAEPRDVLLRLGRRFLTLVLSDDSVRHYRCIVGESQRFPELAEAFYRAGPGAAAGRLAAWLADMHAAGRLDVPDPTRSASLFFGMLRGDLYMQRLTGLTPSPDDATIAAEAEFATDAFLSGHAVT